MPSAHYEFLVPLLSHDFHVCMGKDKHICVCMHTDELYCISHVALQSV